MKVYCLISLCAISGLCQTASLNVQIASTDTTLTLKSGVLFLAGNHSVNLPSASSIVGQPLVIKCTSIGTNLVIPISGQTIDGYTSYTNQAVNDFVVVSSDGNNWWVIASSTIHSFALSFHCATTGNTAISPSVTIYFTLDNSANPMTWTADISGGTRSVVSKNVTFRNLYLVASVAPGSAGCAVTLMTNGVASPLTCSVTTGKSTNDTTHVISVVAGTEVGWKLATGAGVTAAKYSMAIEADHL